MHLTKHLKHPNLSSLSKTLQREEHFLTVWEKHCLDTETHKITRKLQTSKPYELRNENPQQITTKLNLAMCGSVPSIVSTSWDLLLQYGDGLTYENKVTYHAGRMKRKHIVCIFESLSDSEKSLSSAQSPFVLKALNWLIERNYLKPPFQFNCEVLLPKLKG